ncbi:hypothetical protein C8R44DRAFT_808982 [Mycena epipterygia]|nr:hypothetical protein C8R44DRAFT_808982 [Mycena epipterygia]
MALSSQPPELLDLVASFIPLPSDLLSLALTSKALHVVIVPQHLEFREVCCDARRASLWKALAENPNFTARILWLGLIYEPVSRSRTLHLGERVLVPKYLAGDDDAPLAECTSGGIRTNHCQSDCVGALCAAIANMPALKRFAFDASGFGRLHDVQAVFTAVLRSCPSLRELDIAFYDSTPSFDSISEPLWELANLTRVSITVTRHPMIPHATRPYLSEAFEMLSRCPQLEALRIASEMRGPTVDVSAFLTDIYWPYLKSFIIEGDLSLTSSAFLAQHPQLEILSLPHSLTLPALPNLRWLFTPAFVRDVSGPARFPRLEHAAMADVGWQISSDIKDVLRMLSSLPALRGATMSLTVPALKKIAEKVPHMERLSFGRSPWNYDRTRAKENYLPSADCIAILTSFQKLTHLDTSAAITSNADTGSILDALLRALAEAPRLQYVGVDLIYPDCFRPMLKWFSIARDARGAYVGRKEVRDLRKVRYHDWEDVFRQMGIS